MSDASLQRRAGKNQNPRTGSGFSVEIDKYASVARRVTQPTFVMIKHEVFTHTGATGGEDLVILVGMALTIGALINNTPNPISFEMVMVDVLGREMAFAPPGTINAGQQIPVVLGFVPQLTAWILEQGESIELRITAGNPNAGGGLWFWSNKQYTSSLQMLKIRKILDTTGPIVVVEPPGGVTFMPPGFVFNGPFIGATIFNYNLSTAVTVDTILETEDGDLVLESALPVPPNTVTSLVSGVFGGWAVSYPQKLKVQLSAVLGDGDLVFKGNYQRMDTPAVPSP